MKRPRSSLQAIIVGGNAAGLSAASKLKRMCPSARVLVFEQGADISYSNCGIPYLIEGVVREAAHLIQVPPADWSTRRGIDVFTRHKVLAIDRKAMTLTVLQLDTLKEQTLAYDRLLIATGAQPVRPAWAGMDAPNVFTLRNLEDARRLHHFLRPGRNRVAVIGSGYLGLEMTSAFVALGYQVSLIEKAHRIAPSWHERIAERIAAVLQDRGVRLLTGVTVEGFESDEQQLAKRVRFAGTNQAHPADAFIVAVGIRPNNLLAREAGLRLGSAGAIEVDATQRTSDAAIFAAGDCAETTHQLTGEKFWMPLGTTANKQGRIAGENMAGGRRTFRGVLGTAALKLLDLELARTGLTAEQASRRRIEAETVVIQAPDIAGYLPGNKESTVVLYVHRRTGQVLGAEMAGYHGTAKRIDVLATAIAARMTIEQVAELDLTYAPPFAPVWDPILIAANQALKRYRRSG